VERNDAVDAYVLQFVVIGGLPRQAPVLEFVVSTVCLVSLAGDQAIVNRFIWTALTLGPPQAKACVVRLSFGGPSDCHVPALGLGIE